jgi:Carboxypeptidase regulatory-like domain
MKQTILRIIVISLSLAFLALPLIVVHGAGGRIEGKVTNPKGELVVGATVTVAGPDGDQTRTAVTDGEGRFKIEGLKAGTYTVTISAKGFSDARREGVKVEEGAVATFDARLEIAAIQSAVNVPASGVKANADPVYQQLRQLGKSDAEFGGSFATVSNLVLKRDEATFTLHNGEVYFAPPIEGRVTGAVFVGDGELVLDPPLKNTPSLFLLTLRN